GYRAMAREAGAMVTKFTVRHQFMDGNRVCSIIDWEMAPARGPHDQRRAAGGRERLPCPWRTDLRRAGTARGHGLGRLTGPGAAAGSGVTLAPDEPGRNCEDSPGGRAHDDALLLRRAKGGDQAAFASLVALTARSFSCTATGCSAHSMMPKTSLRRCS